MDVGSDSARSEGSGVCDLEERQRRPHGGGKRLVGDGRRSSRDLVFLPTSSAAPDYYGALRLGDNRYANSIVALRASTGAVVWHFQTVHHDLWDYDNASPPALVNVTRDGKTIPAVVQATKTGQLFVLHRETGVPIFRWKSAKSPRARFQAKKRRQRSRSPR